MTCAPISFFVYNRPDHTKRTVEALIANTLAIKSDLIIFSDAPRSEAQVQKVQEVRQYIREISGFKSVTVIERETNYGLARSIIEGVTEVVNQHGSIIVLEDDMVTSPNFLTFMNDALNVYREEEKVMHVSGYMFPIDATGLPETFFLRTASCWGWATWARAWKHFRKEPGKLINEYTKQQISRFNMDDANTNFWEQVSQNDSGSMNTWAIFWYATIFQMNGLCLHPAISMVINIGHDGSGEHCISNNYFSTVLASNQVKTFEKILTENALAYERTRKFYLALRPSIFRRFASSVKQRITRFSKSGVIKDKLN